MRKLHPVGAHEATQDAGRFRRFEGEVETWTVHGLPGGRRAVRVEADGGDLWHLILDADGLPERLEARLREGARTLDVTYTFFADECLVWRRGAAPATEAIALAAGCRLLWPPMAGREHCLGGARAAGGAAPFLCLARVPAAEGWLAVRPTTLEVRADGAGLVLEGPGTAPMRAQLDEAGRLQRWADDGGAMAVRLEPA